MTLSENFTYGFQNVTLMISKVRRVENEDLKACERILQTGHLLARNGVKDEFGCF